MKTSCGVIQKATKLVVMNKHFRRWSFVDVFPSRGS